MEFTKDYLEREMLEEYSKAVIDFFRSNGLSSYLDNLGIDHKKICSMTFTMDLGSDWGFIYIPNANSIAHQALSMLSEMKFGNDFVFYHKTDRSQVAYIAIDEWIILNGEIAKRTLIHETWHLLEYLTVGYDLLGEGTAKHIEFKYSNKNLTDKEIKEKLSSISNVNEKFNIILYCMAASEVQKSNAPPSAFLENKNLRKKLIGELTKEFDVNFTKQETADLIVQKNLKTFIQPGINKVNISEKEIINELKQKFPEVAEKFEKYGIPSEIMESLRKSIIF